MSKAPSFGTAWSYHGGNRRVAQEERIVSARQTHGGRRTGKRRQEEEFKRKESEDKHKFKRQLIVGIFPVRDEVVTVTVIVLLEPVITTIWRANHQPSFAHFPARMCLQLVAMMCLLLLQLLGLCRKHSLFIPCSRKARRSHSSNFIHPFEVRCSDVL
jgi:hypothetical protein